jgi:hypothetical protein
MASMSTAFGCAAARGPAHCGMGPVRSGRAPRDRGPNSAKELPRLPEYVRREHDDLVDTQLRGVTGSVMVVWTSESSTPCCTTAPSTRRHPRLVHPNGDVHRHLRAHRDHQHRIAPSALPHPATNTQGLHEFAATAWFRPQPQPSTYLATAFEPVPWSERDNQQPRPTGGRPLLPSERPARDKMPTKTNPLRPARIRTRTTDPTTESATCTLGDQCVRAVGTVRTHWGSGPSGGRTNLCGLRRSSGRRPGT